MPGQIEQQHAILAGSSADGGIQPFDDCPRRSRHQCFVRAEQWRRHWHQGLLHHLRGISLAGPAPEHAQLIDALRHGGIHLRLACLQGQLQRRVMGVQRQQHQLRGEGVQLRIIGQQCLAVHAVGRNMQRQRQAPLQSGHADGRQQVIDRMRGQQCHPQWRQACRRGVLLDADGSQLVQSRGEGEIPLMSGQLDGFMQPLQRIFDAFGLADGTG